MSEPELNQSAIDSLFSVNGSEQKIAPVDFQKRKSLTVDQMQLLIAENIVFARSSSDRLSAWLNTNVSIQMMAAERVLFSEHLATSDVKGTYYGEARFSSSQPILFSLDNSFIGAVVHLVLGGASTIPEPLGDRPLTYIDSALMEVLLTTVCAELNQIWTSCDLIATYKSEVISANIGKIFAQEEYLLVFTYEMKIGTVEGVVQVALSTTIADTLLRQLDRNDTSRTQPPETRAEIYNRLETTRHKAHLRSPSFRIRVADLIEMAPGTLLPCGISHQAPASFGVQGGRVWKAKAGTREGRIVAQIFE